MRFPPILLVTVLLAVATFGQSFKASLVGIVTDPQKDVTPGARVTLDRAETGEKFTAVTDEDGGHSFQQITPGVYLLRIEAPGFAAHIEENPTLEVSQARRFNVTWRRTRGRQRGFCCRCANCRSRCGLLSEFQSSQKL